MTATFATDDVLLSGGSTRAVLDHVHTDTDNEVGGVFVGRLEDGVARIDHVLPALEAVGGAAQLTFTHDVWEDLLTTVDRDHPDLQIVGWYHSHPGHGIFLSSYDQFIHENFFSAPGMVALVVDPRDDDAFGWFGWNDGELTRLGSGLPVDRPDRAPIPREISDATDSEAAATSRIDTVRDGVLIAVAVLLVFFAGGWFGSQPVEADLNDARQQNRELRAIATQQQSLAQQQDGDLHAVCQALVHAAPSPAADPEIVEDADPTDAPSAAETAPAGQAAEDPDDPVARAHQICTAYAPPQPAEDAEATDGEPTPDGANSPTPSETP